MTPAPAPRATVALRDDGAVTAAAFGQRRKMLRASLRSLGDAEALLAEAGIDADRAGGGRSRSQRLVRLARAWLNR